MSRVITFSRVFPSYHPRKGEPTYFVDKLYAGFADCINGFKIPNEANDYWDFYEYYNCKTPKFHTIRAGNRWKAGDKFSPRVWSGKPYNSKQIIIAPDIEIKKVWEINMVHYKYYWFISKKIGGGIQIDTVARNDGLTTEDFMNWFPKPDFSGQIICWNSEINY